MDAPCDTNISDQKKLSTKDVSDHLEYITSQSDELDYASEAINKIPGPTAVTTLTPGSPLNIQCEKCDNQNQIEDNEFSEKMAVAEALLELHKAAKTIQTTFRPAEMEDQTLKEEMLNEIENSKNIVSNGEKICHAIHKNKKLTLVDLLRSNDDLNCFTGVNYMILNNLVDAVAHAEGQRQATRFGISIKERIILTLCKLKLNLSYNKFSSFVWNHPSNNEHNFFNHIAHFSIYS